ncbi:glycerol-3-phosphate responsive antiterminator [Streptococcus suis]|nr:glycerol-3-phosphate responsive antiterminator [Streptococcus suis]
MDKISLIKQNPRIPAVNSYDSLNRVIHSANKVVYVLFGDINTINTIIRELKEAGKVVFVNIDLIEGLASKEATVEFIQNNTGADGIISSKSNVVRAASDKGIFAIQRSFAIDSKAFSMIPKLVNNSRADVLDLQPGSMPKVIKWVLEKINIPVIASGLVCEIDDIENALEAGAIGVSSTNECILQ